MWPWDFTRHPGCNKRPLPLPPECSYDIHASHDQNLVPEPCHHSVKCPQPALLNQGTCSHYPHYMPVEVMLCLFEVLYLYSHHLIMQWSHQVCRAVSCEEQHYWEFKWVSQATISSSYCIKKNAQFWEQSKEDSIFFKWYITNTWEMPYSDWGSWISTDWQF